jgi:hypothetical protein
MAAEDHNGEVVSSQGECPDCITTTRRERSFDELAKSLADGKLSRRKALRMLGGAVMGSVLASVPGMAWAAKPTCAGGATKCGRNCCPDSTYVCSKGKCACPTGTTPIGNTCCQNAQVCGSSFCCQTGQSCVDGQCVFQDMCDPGSTGAATCGPNPNGVDCACRREEVGTGRAVCIEGSIYNCRPPCTSTSECPPHTVCVQLVGATEGTCATLCGEGCEFTTQCCAPGFPSDFSTAGECSNEDTVRIVCAQSGYCQQTCPEGQTLDLYTCECV